MNICYFEANWRVVSQLSLVYADVIDSVPHTTFNLDQSESLKEIEGGMGRERRERGERERLDGT